jgi:organic radical activating enzyme
MQLEKLKSSSAPLYLMPASGTSLAIYELLKKEGIPVSGFLDNSIKKQELVYRDLPVRSPETLTEKDAHIIITSLNYINKMDAQLRDTGFSNIIPLSEIVSYEEKAELRDVIQNMDMEVAARFASLTYKNVTHEFIYEYLLKNLSKKNNTDKVCLHSVDFRITDRCNLRCESCANWMQYFDKPCDVDIETVKYGLTCVSKIADSIGLLAIIGGEPFVYRELKELLEFPLMHQISKTVEIVSNGTILPSDDILASIKEHDYCISISNYGEISKKRTAFIELIKNYGISFSDRDYDKWIVMNSYTEPADNTEQQNRFNNCVYYCRTLCGTKLSYCEPIMSAYRLHALPADNFTTEGENPEILDVTQCTKDDLRRYLNREVPFNTCKICAGRPLDLKQIEPAIQSKSPLPYKKY